MSFGRLERNPGAPPISAINMTPLIDVMLVLLVIFIITAPLMATGLRLDLPRADAAAPAEPARVLALALDEQGRLFVDERPVEPDALRARLAEAAALDPDTEVQLRADRRVPYGRVAELMGWVQAAGLARIGFLTEGDGAAAPPR